MCGRLKLLGQRLFVKHIKVVANDDEDPNAGLGESLNDLVDYLDYMLKFPALEKNNEHLATTSLNYIGLLSGDGRTVVGKHVPETTKVLGAVPSPGEGDTTGTTFKSLHDTLGSVEIDKFRGLAYEAFNDPDKVDSL